MIWHDNCSIGTQLNLKKGSDFQSHLGTCIDYPFLLFMEWKRQRVLSSWFINKPTSLFFFFFSIFAVLFTIIRSTSASTTTTCASDCSCPLSTAKADINFQKFGDQLQYREKVVMMSLSLARRYLSGPGSSPPRCTSKCGRCKPCKPVHVPVPPGTPVTAEYYPEAWRCKCGNKLYMP